MANGVLISPVQIEQFSDDYKLASQQIESRVADVVYNKTFTGSVLQDSYKAKIATSDVIRGRETGADTVIKDTSFVTRRLIAETATYPTLLADKDIVEMIKNPKGEVVQSMIAAMNNIKDLDTITAMRGNASTKNATTGVWEDIALPAGQKIPFGTTALTVEKLRAAKVLLDKAEQPKTGRCIIANATEIDNLLAETEVTSSDYNTVKTLVQGDLDTFLGFKFIQTELVPDGFAVAFQKDGVLFGTNLGRQIKIKEHTGKYCDWLIMVEEQFGALRREDTAVVEIATA